MQRIDQHIHLTGAVDWTGGLRAAVNTQRLTAAYYQTMLVVSDRWHGEESAMPVGAITLPVRIPARSPLAMVTYPFTLVRSTLALWRLVRRTDASTIAVNDFFYMEPVVLRLFGYRGRIVTWIRIDPRRYGRIGRLWLKAARWASNEMVGVSDFILSALPGGMGAIRVYDPAPVRTLTTKAQGQRLLFIGNYIPGKGQDCAIKAFKRIADRFPEATLRFIGGDLGLDSNRSYRANLQELAKEGSGGDRIEFCDFTDNVSAELDSCLAALNFSQSESFSLTCLEASANGRAVIATMCGGPEEIVDDQSTGFLVPIGDVDAMADRMAYLLDNPEIAARMGEQGAKVVAERFGEKNFVNQVRQVITPSAVLA